MKLNENEVGFWSDSFIAALRECFEIRKDELGRLFCVRLAAEIADDAVLARRQRIDESTDSQGRQP